MDNEYLEDKKARFLNGDLSLSIRKDSTNFKNFQKWVARVTKNVYYSEIKGRYIWFSTVPKKWFQLTNRDIKYFVKQDKMYQIEEIDNEIKRLELLKNNL